MKKLRWGVIGCGGIAMRRTIPGLILAENSELVSVMDSNGEAALLCKEKFGAKYAFTEYSDLLACEDVDAVYIASPVACHFEQAVAAARAKKHILLEKPLGITVSQAKEILDECNKQGVKLGSGFMMRFNSIHEQVRDLVSKGGLGDIVSMRAQFTCWYPEIKGAWRQVKATSGGGALMDMGVHCIDLLRFMSGLEAKEVTAFTGNQIFKYEVEDAASVIMRMSNGSLAYVDAAFNIPDEAAVCKLEIYGTGGSVFLQGSLAQDETGEGVLILTDSNRGYDAQQNRVKAENTVLKAGDGNLYTKEIAAFAQAVIDGTDVPVTAMDAIKAQSIVEAAYDSANNKTVVELD